MSTAADDLSRRRPHASPGGNVSDAELATLRDSLHRLAAVTGDMAADQKVAERKALSPAGSVPRKSLLTTDA